MKLNSYNLKNTKSWFPSFIKILINLILAIRIQITQTDIATYLLYKFTDFIDLGAMNNKTCQEDASPLRELSPTFTSGTIPTWHSIVIKHNIQTSLLRKYERILS